MSAKCGKPCMWEFSVTAHGKGIIDGVGGHFKLFFRLKITSKAKNLAIVLKFEDFLAFATKLWKNR